MLARGPEREIPVAAVAGQAHGGLRRGGNAGLERAVRLLHRILQVLGRVAVAALAHAAHRVALGAVGSEVDGLPLLLVAVRANRRHRPGSWLGLRKGRHGQERSEDRQDPGRRDDGLDSHVNPFLSFDLLPVSVPGTSRSAARCRLSLCAERSPARMLFGSCDPARNAFRHEGFVSCLLLVATAVLRPARCSCSKKELPQVDCILGSRRTQGQGKGVRQLATVAKIPH